MHSTHAQPHTHMHTHRTAPRAPPSPCTHSPCPPHTPLKYFGVLPETWIIALGSGAWLTRASSAWALLPMDLNGNHTHVNSNKGLVQTFVWIVIVLLKVELNYVCNSWKQWIKNFVIICWTKGTKKDECVNPF